MQPRVILLDAYLLGVSGDGCGRGHWHGIALLFCWEGFWKLRMCVIVSSLSSQIASCSWLRVISKPQHQRKECCVYLAFCWRIGWQPPLYNICGATFSPIYRWYQVVNLTKVINFADIYKVTLAAVDGVVPDTLPQLEGCRTCVGARTLHFVLEWGRNHQCQTEGQSFWPRSIFLPSNPIVIFWLHN